MPAGNAHRLLSTMYDAFSPVGGAGVVATPTATGQTIEIDLWGQICPVVTGGAWAATLAQPNRAGILGGICLDTDGGDLTLTVTGGYNEDGDTSITFDTAGNYIVLWSIKVGSSYYWRVIAQEGTTASVEEGTFDTITATTANLTTVAATTVTATTVSKPAAAAAEHGAGAIGTGVAPTTTRFTRDGVIITEIAIDLTGLASKNTANDIIGLAAGGAAIIGRNVVATNGIIFKIEMICLEVPATGDTDLDLVSGSAADDEYDEAVTGAAVEINGGTWAAGTVVQTLVPAVAANYYLYLTTGAGATAGTYTTGQFIIRLHGHAVLA